MREDENRRKEMITIERASELVFALASTDKREEAIDLFCHFVDFFEMSQDKTEMFAILCKYLIATNVKIVE